MNENEKTLKPLKVDKGSGRMKARDEAVGGGKEDDGKALSASSYNRPSVISQHLPSFHALVILPFTTLTRIQTVKSP